MLSACYVGRAEAEDNWKGSVEKMHYREAIENFAPRSEREAADKAAMQNFIAHYGDEILDRNPIAHLAASAFILNPARDKALLLRHKILQKWAWAGGHADGNPDLAAVALKEAGEETGAEGFSVLTPNLVSLEVLPVPAHVRRGVFVSNHLHLDASYLLILSEDAPFRVKPDENEAIAWFHRREFTVENFSPADTELYNKLFDYAREL